MNYEDADELYNVAQEKVHAALQELAEFWGPRICEHGDYSDCDDCEFKDTKSAPDSLLSEFVVVASWTSMESGKSNMTWVTPHGQLSTHTNGLLFTALYE